MKFAPVEPLALDLSLPWQEDQDQEARFRKLVKRLLIALAVLGLIIPWLPVFEPEYTETEDSVTKTEVMLEPVEEDEPEPVPEPEPEPVEPREEPAPEPEPEQVVQEPAAEQAPPPEPDEDSVKKEQGLAGLSEQLSAVRGKVDVSKMQRRNVSRSELGEVEYSQRDRLGEEDVARRSEGIQVDEDLLAEDVSLDEYSGVAVEASEYSDQPDGGQMAFLSDRAGRRDMENIRRTFEAAKGRVYALYQEKLKEDPSLSGKFIFRLVIEPDGSISELELVSSELEHRSLEETILQRIGGINFGAREVSPTAVEYAFSFIPS